MSEREILAKSIRKAILANQKKLLANQGKLDALLKGQNAIKANQAEDHRQPGQDFTERSKDQCCQQVVTDCRARIALTSREHANFVPTPPSPDCRVFRAVAHERSRRAAAAATATATTTGCRSGARRRAGRTATAEEHAGAQGHSSGSDSADDAVHRRVAGCAVQLLSRAGAERFGRQGAEENGARNDAYGRQAQRGVLDRTAPRQLRFVPQRTRAASTGRRRSRLR